MTTAQNTPRTITQFKGAWGFLSNPYTYRVTVEGVVYPSAEHAFQAQKTINPGIRRQISCMPNWRDAKQLGRTTPLRSGWNEYWRYVAMMTVLRNKFSDGLVGSLLGTGNAYLIEGNHWHDNTWGICYCGKCTNGHNLLGWMLMQLRNELSVGRR
jgi:ribA/ribD-fused uncharacterized protein